MEINDLNDKIKLKNLQIQVEKDYKKKQEYRNQLKILQFKKEIEIIKKKIKQIC